MRKYLVTMLLIALFNAQSAQAEELLWQQSIFTHDVASNWTLFGEIQPRWLGGLKNTQAVLMRMAILHRLSPEIRVGLGFGNTPQYLPTLRNEVRFFQQLEWTPSPLLESVSFSCRTRLEQRWLENASSTAWRIREKIQFNWEPGVWGVYFWDEAFFHFAEVSGMVRSGFDQNRLSFGPRYRKGPVTIELGFLSQVIRSYSKAMLWNAGGVMSVGLAIE